MYRICASSTWLKSFYFLELAMNAGSVQGNDQEQRRLESIRDQSVDQDERSGNGDGQAAQDLPTADTQNRSQRPPTRREERRDVNFTRRFAKRRKHRVNLGFDPKRRQVRPKSRPGNRRPPVVNQQETNRGAVIRRVDRSRERMEQLRELYAPYRKPDGTYYCDGCNHAFATLSRFAAHREEALVE